MACVKEWFVNGLHSRMMYVVMNDILTEQACYGYTGDKLR